MDPLSDATNDISGAHDPEFTPIAICIGTDLDSNPVTLVDRLCLNRPAVELIVGDMQICQQEAMKSEVQYQQCKVDLKSTEAMAVGSGCLAALFFFGLLMMSWIANSRGK